MKKMMLTLMALAGLSSLHESKATVLYSENFEDVAAGNPNTNGYNLDGTGWGWGVTTFKADGSYNGNYFPAGGPNPNLYSVRTDQGGVNQGQNIITFAGDYGVPANVATHKAMPSASKSCGKLILPKPSLAWWCTRLAGPWTRRPTAASPRGSASPPPCVRWVRLWGEIRSR